MEWLFCLRKQDKENKKRNQNKKIAKEAGEEDGRGEWP
jgi:hypothetical protein